MKKIVSLLLTALMAFSAMTVGAFSASAATVDDDIAIEAGSRIYFDNTNTKWENIYFYAWSYGYYGDFVPMEAVADHENLYSVVVPVDVPPYVEKDGVNVPTEFFLFTNSTDWSGQQTANMPVEVGKNTYTPVVDEEGNITVELSYTDIPATTEALATPYSKSFTDTIDVTVYAFNLPEGVKSTYQINDAAPVEFTEPTKFTLSATSTVIVTAGNVTKSYTYTKVSDAVINVIAVYEDNTPYDGNIYAYTFGGDRVGESFNLMTNNGGGSYSYRINGSAHVIFTDINVWNIATKKFTISDISGVLPDQEPLVSAGEEVTYFLTYPGSPAK